MSHKSSVSNGTWTDRFSTDEHENEQEVDQESEDSSYSFTSQDKCPNPNSNSVNHSSSSSSSDSCSYDSSPNDEEEECQQGNSGELLENGMNGKTINSRHSNHNHTDARAVHGSQAGLPLFTMRKRRSSSPPLNGTTNIASHPNTKKKTSTSASASNFQQRSSQHASRRHRPSYSSHNRKKNSSYAVQSVASLYLKSIQTIVSKKSSAFLLFSILTWLYVQFQFATDFHNMQSNSYTYQGQGQGQSVVPRSAEIQQKIAEIRKRKEQSALQSLGSAAKNYVLGNKKPSKDGYGPTGDKAPSGCTMQDWQRENHPFCNEVHSFDLRRVYIPDRDLDRGHDLGGKSQSQRQGYLGSGLWRQVWKIIPSSHQQGEEAVLKIMKRDQDVNPRNFDRHRRDALVMERLTESERVVSIYAFCGNTVLTEYAGITLDDFLFKEGFQKEPWSRRYDLMRKDGMGKVQLALDVMKGVEDMHQHDILHADIQAKQFLLDPVEGVKVNDFNRCRFLPTNDQTGKLCNVKIPSAPGAQRSPEEYELQKIGIKADIFSSANILFGILTGAKPWGEDLMKKDIRKNVMKGNKPKIDEKFLRKGTVDAKLAKIVLKAYEFKPEDRWSASQIIRELEYIKDRSLR